MSLLKDRVFILVEFSRHDWRIAHVDSDLWADIDLAIINKDEEQLYELIDEVDDECYIDNGLEYESATEIVNTLCDYEVTVVPMSLEEE